MNIYEEYSNSNYKADFFRKIDDKDKKELWNNMTMGDKKSLFSWLSIDDINKFLVSLSEVDRKKSYEYIDKNKLKGIYKSLDDEGKKEMLDNIDSRTLDLMNEKDKANDNISKATDNIKNANDNIVKANVNIANARVEINDIKRQLKDNKINLKKATREEKKKYKQMLKASKCSILDKVGIIARYRANKLANITEEYLELSKLVNNLREDEANLNIKLDNKEKEIDHEKEKRDEYNQQIKGNNSIIRDNVYNISNINLSIKSLNANEKKLLGRKLFNKKASNRVINTNRLKNKEEAIRIDNVLEDEKSNVKEEVVDNSIYVNNTVEKVKGEVIDTKKTVENTVNRIDSIHDMGVEFYPPLPVCQNVNFNSNIERKPINNINYEQLLVFYSVMSYYCVMQLEKQNAINNSMDQGNTRVYSKGNVSIFMLVGIIIMLLCMYFFIV